jgi:hypothetical protein
METIPGDSRRIHSAQSCGSEDEYQQPMRSGRQLEKKLMLILCRATGKGAIGVQYAMMVCDHEIHVPLKAKTTPLSLSLYLVLDAIAKSGRRRNE